MNQNIIELLKKADDIGLCNPCTEAYCFANAIGVALRYVDPAQKANERSKSRDAYFSALDAALPGWDKGGGE